MKVSLLKRILPQAVRVPLVIQLRKWGFTTWVQSKIYLREAELLRKAHSTKPSRPVLDYSQNKVLIVCAHFNHARFLQDCVSSVLDQTHINWELIIVDDNSTQQEVSKALEVQELRDSRITTICLKENSGAYIARNTGITAASLAGANSSNWTHVTFIDPDDVARPNWLHHTLSILDGREGSVRPFLQRYDTTLTKPLQVYFGHCQTLHSRFVWNRAGGFLPVRRSGDSEMTLRLSHLSKDGQSEVFKSFETAQILRHIPGSATHQDLTARKVWLEKRDDELASMSIADMQISNPEIAEWEKCGE